jgi:cellulose biosynthesis protein BcsQ
MTQARRSIVDINRGGTGKTTVLQNMSWLDAMIAGERVLILDNDTNAGQTFLSLGTNFDAHGFGKQTIYDVLTNLDGGISNAVFSLDLSAAIAAREKISHLIPSHLLASRPGTIDIVAGTRLLGEAPIHFGDRKQPVGRFTQAIDWLLRQPEVNERYSAIWIDNGPDWTPQTQAALAATHYAIIPCQVSLIDVRAMDFHRNRIGDINANAANYGVQSHIRIAGAIASIVDRASTYDMETLPDLYAALEEQGVPHFKTTLMKDDTVKRAAEAQTPTWVYAPQSAAARQYIDAWMEYRTKLAE